MRMTIVSGTQRCAILNLEQRVRVIKCDHAVQLCTCSVCGCTEATETCPNSGKQNFPKRQGLKNTKNSKYSSSSGFGPTLTMMTKLFAGWPAIPTKLSAGFPATVCRTPNLFPGQLRCRILRCLQSVVLFASLCLLRIMALYSCWVLAKCTSCNRLHSLFA